MQLLVEQGLGEAQETGANMWRGSEQGAILPQQYTQAPSHHHGHQDKGYLYNHIQQQGGQSQTWQQSQGYTQHNPQLQSTIWTGHQQPYQVGTPPSALQGDTLPQMAGYLQPHVSNHNSNLDQQPYITVPGNMSAVEAQLSWQPVSSAVTPTTLHQAQPSTALQHQHHILLQPPMHRSSTQPWPQHQLATAQQQPTAQQPTGQAATQQYPANSSQPSNQTLIPGVGQVAGSAPWALNQHHHQQTMHANKLDSAQYPTLSPTNPPPAKRQHVVVKSEPALETAKKQRTYQSAPTAGHSQVNKQAATAATQNTQQQKGQGKGAGTFNLPKTQRSVYARLSTQIEQLIAQLAPTAADQQYKQRVLTVVKTIVRSALPEYTNLQVMPFGSYASGLGTKSSDLDVVVLGVMEPSNLQGFYDRGERPRVAKLLDRVQKVFRQRRDLLRIQNLLAIKHARMPILKVTLADGLEVDLSISSRGGVDMSTYVKEAMQRLPTLRPLVLVVKQLLKAYGLNDVPSGGLASCGLTYMAHAHLLDELQLGTDTDNLGLQLHRFLWRFGVAFDMADMAVAPALGGFSMRDAVGQSCVDPENARICVLDPLTGRNVTDGCQRSAEVIKVFAQACQIIDEYMDTFANGSVKDTDDLLGRVLQATALHDTESDEDAVRLGKRKRRPD